MHQLQQRILGDLLRERRYPRQLEWSSPNEIILAQIHRPMGCRFAEANDLAEQAHREQRLTRSEFNVSPQFQPLSCIERVLPVSRASCLTFALNLESHTMNIEEMRDKIGPWMPAVFCASLAVIVTIGNLWAVSAGGSDSAITLVYILFLPMCFFLIGRYLVKLNKDITELRERLDAADRRSDRAIGRTEHRPENDGGEQADAGKSDPAAS